MFTPAAIGSSRRPSRLREPLARHPIERLVERAGRAGRTVRRSPCALMMSGGDSVSTSPHHRAHDQAFGFGELHRARADAVLRHRTSACSFLSATSSTPPIRPSPRASPTSGCVAERLEPRLELRRALGGFFDDALARVDLDRLERDRGGNRMAAIGEAVAEHADLFALGEQRLIHRLRNHDAGDRQIGRRQRLGDRERMRARSRASRSRTWCRAGRSRRSLRR